MKIINGEEFYSVKELKEILGLSLVGVFCILRSSRIKCVRFRNGNYASKKDILKSLDPKIKL